MTIIKQNSGILIYTLHKNYLIQKLYVGYTLAEAKSLFRKLLKQK